MLFRNIALIILILFSIGEFINALLFKGNLTSYFAGVCIGAILHSIISANQMDGAKRVIFLQKGDKDVSSK